MLRRPWNILAVEDTLFWGPCLYFTRGYTGFRLVKNLTPSTLKLKRAKASPVRKRVRSLQYIVQISRKQKIKKIAEINTKLLSPFGYFSPRALTLFLDIVLLQHVFVP